MRNLYVNEIFYSLQGEGARAGTANIFVRLANCNKDCWFCDTDWTKGIDRSIDSVLFEIQQYPCKNIIWTGGEPALQLTQYIIDFFKENGYYQSIETNGSVKLPSGIDYVVSSPKVPFKELRSNFPDGLQELRFPVSKDMMVPKIELLPKAEHYYLSPIFEGDVKKRFELKQTNLDYCIALIKENPIWKLSVQQHKIWNIR